MKVKAIRCSKHICRVVVPWETLVLLPESRVFEPVWRLPRIYFFKKQRTGCIVELPSGTILRVGKTPKTKYYLIDGDVIELIGKRVKIIGLNTWGWYYINPRTNESVVVVIYREGVFEALRRI